MWCYAADVARTAVLLSAESLRTTTSSHEFVNLPVEIVIVDSRLRDVYEIILKHRRGPSFNKRALG
jgi:hypothetical protein